MGTFARLGFSVVCVFAIMVSVIFPSWAAVVQSQAYGGYVDMALESLGFPDEVIAGTEVTLPLRVSNLGPDTADYPQVVFSSGARFQLAATSGCISSPLVQSQCLIPAPLAAGESRDLAFTGVVDPGARGLVTPAAFALSEGIDEQAGNEIVVAAITVLTEVDVGVRPLTLNPQVAVDGRLYWDIEVTNRGPSDAQQLRLQFYQSSTDEFDLDCEAIGLNSQCPDQIGRAGIGRAGALNFRASFPPLSAVMPEAALSIYAQPTESEADYSDNNVFLLHADLMHVDDFEY